jgi:hypothetical protein
MERRCGGTEGDSDEGQWWRRRGRVNVVSERRRRACDGLVWHQGSRGNPPNWDWLVKVELEILAFTAF